MKRMLPILLTPLLVVALLVSSSACGTITNFSGPLIRREAYVDVPPRPFGGVFADVGVLTDRELIENRPGLIPLIVLDICLSAVGDTVTLPFVIFRSWEEVLKLPPNAPSTFPTKESDNALSLPPVKLFTEPPSSPEPRR